MNCNQEMQIKTKRSYITFNNINETHKHNAEQQHTKHKTTYTVQFSIYVKLKNR